MCSPFPYALIAARGINTLVLVHRTELLRQWQERLQAFLGVGNGVVGMLPLTEN